MGYVAKQVGKPDVNVLQQFFDGKPPLAPQSNPPRVTVPGNLAQVSGMVPKTAMHRPKKVRVR